MVWSAMPQEWSGIRLVTWSFILGYFGWVWAALLAIWVPAYGAKIDQIYFFCCFFYTRHTKVSYGIPKIKLKYCWWIWIFCHKVHFCSILTPFGTPQVANEASHVHPRWPLVKGRATNIMPLHSRALQNLPLTAEWKNCLNANFCFNFTLFWGP